MKKTTLLILEKTKLASEQIANLSEKRRKNVLIELIKQLNKHKKEIFSANKKDIESAILNGKTKAFVERLTITEKSFEGMTTQLRIVADLENVLGETIEHRIVKNEIDLRKIRFPIGVIFVVYESRPNITIDIAGLCIKSGNAVVLKGGKESILTNKILMNCVNKSLKKFGVDIHAVSLLENISHEEMTKILSRQDLFDVVIPRGSERLIDAVARASKIPILYHAAGGARAYIDKSADVNMAVDLVINAKVQRNSVCNALDCIVIHKDVAKKIIIKIVDKLKKNNVEIRADNYVQKLLNKTFLKSSTKKATEKDFSTEFLDAIVAVKVVKNAEEAIEFIKKHSHHHTEMLIAEDKKITNKFIQEIDAAALMINCSSRLHDGGEFGMGAEMGTATGKLHARGPVGIKELTTYKWIAVGNGQIKK